MPAGTGYNTGQSPFENPGGFGQNYGAFENQWNDYWSNSSAGDVFNLGGGTLTRGDRNEAYWSEPGNAGFSGNQQPRLIRSTDDPFNVARQHNTLGQSWLDSFGSDLFGGRDIRQTLPGGGIVGQNTDPYTGAIIPQGQTGGNFGGIVDAVGNIVNPGGSSTGAGTGTGGGSTGGNINLPSTTIPGLEPIVTGLLGTNFQDAYDKYAALPGQIDQFTDDAIKRQRLTGDQATRLLSKVAGQRASSGIQGGTEAENLRSGVINDFLKNITTNQQNLQATGAQMKASAISNLPQVALGGVTAGTNLFNSLSADQQGWANNFQNWVNRFY